MLIAQYLPRIAHPTCVFPCDKSWTRHWYSLIYVWFHHQLYLAIESLPMIYVKRKCRSELRSLVTCVWFDFVARLFYIIGTYSTYCSDHFVLRRNIPLRYSDDSVRVRFRRGPAIFYRQLYT